MALWRACALRLQSPGGVVNCPCGPRRGLAPWRSDATFTLQLALWCVAGQAECPCCRARATALATQPGTGLSTRPCQGEGLANGSGARPIDQEPESFLNHFEGGAGFKFELARCTMDVATAETLSY